MPARGSYSWIAAAMILTAASGYASIMESGFLFILFTFLFIIGMILTIFLFIFFRDPERIPMGDEGDMISPADGKVISIKDKTISIFMNIHNVHVNRAPLSGTITQIDYKPGGYIPAFNKDSYVNERNRIVINSEYGNIELTQIAGVLTRRIVSYISEGIFVKRGERIGIIRFGSRVDVVIPQVFEINVELNDKVKAGETIIAIRRG